MKRKPIGSLASDPNDDLNYDPFYSNLPTSLPGVGTTQGGINTAPTLGVRLPNGQTSGRQLPMSGMALPTTPAPTLNPAQPRLGRSIPSIPGQDEMIAPVEATQSASTNGTQKIRDLFSGGLKGLGDFLYNPEQGKQIGNLLAEMGYSMAYRSAGNKDDYYSSWNRGTNLNNANSDYSRNTRDLLAKIDPERTKAMAGYDKLSGEEAMGLYDTVLNKERYMDMEKQQSADKYNAVLEKERLRRQGRSSGNPSGNPTLSKQEMAQLPKYSALKMGHETLQRDFDELKKELGVSSLSELKDLPGVANIPLYGVIDNGGRGAKIRSLIEKIIAPERHKLFGSALTGMELGSANRIYGQSGFTDKNIIDALDRAERASSEDYLNLDAGYTDNVTNYRENKLNKITQKAQPNQSSPQGKDPLGLGI